MCEEINFKEEKNVKMWKLTYLKSNISIVIVKETMLMSIQQRKMGKMITKVKWSDFDLKMTGMHDWFLWWNYCWDKALNNKIWCDKVIFYFSIFICINIYLNILVCITYIVDDSSALGVALKIQVMGLYKLMSCLLLVHRLRRPI